MMGSMIERVASCACGTLTAAARGEPTRISICHCGECKRRTGSAFSLNATWPDDQVTIRGEATQFERSGEDGGHWVRESFCPRCGVRIFYRIELRPRMVSIPVGAFRDRDFPAPQIAVYAELAMRAIELSIEPTPEQL